MLEKQLEHLEAMESGIDYGAHIGVAGGIFAEKRAEMEIATDQIRIAGEDEKEVEQMLKDQNNLIEEQGSEDEDELFAGIEELEKEVQLKYPPPNSKPPS